MIHSLRTFGSDNLPYEQIGDQEPVCIADELPFEIPESWEWCRLGNIVHNHGQKKPDKRFSYIDIGSIDNRHQCLNATEILLEAEKAPSRARKLICMGDILYATVRPYLHNMCIVDREFMAEPIASTGFAVLSCFAGMSNEFLFYYLMSPAFDSYANDSENSKGVAYPAINDTRLYNALIPLPPYLEQLRIVEKYQELLPFIEEYTTKEEQAQSLNDSFPDQLRKSILQYAVQGKLVPQDPDDEPASVLLDHIRAEKEKLIAAGKIKRDKHESVIYRRDNSHYEKIDGVERCIEDEIPFEIPENWAWCRLGSIITLLSGTDFKPEEYNNQHKGIPYITGASNISDEHILENRWTEHPRVVANEGDLLLVCKGSGYGKTIICDLKEAHIARQIMAIKKSPLVCMKYIQCVLSANLDTIKAQGQGVIPGIDRNSVLLLMCPLPPYDEQLRIVSEMAQLSVLCKQIPS